MNEPVLDILTIVILIVLTVLAGVVVVILGTLPGKIAGRRNHPQAEALNVASWLGIIMGALPSMQKDAAAKLSSLLR